MAVETRETRTNKSLDEVAQRLEQATMAVEELILAVGQAELKPELEECFKFSLEALRDLMKEQLHAVRDQTISLAMFKAGLEAIIGHE